MLPWNMECKKKNNERVDGCVVEREQRDMALLNVNSIEAFYNTRQCHRTSVDILKGRLSVS